MSRSAINIVHVGVGRRRLALAVTVYTDHHNTSSGGISVRSTYSSVVWIIWNLISPHLRHVKPLGMPDVRLQPHAASLATGIFSK